MNKPVLCENVKDFAEKLFVNEPKEPHSIPIGIDIDDTLNVEILSKFLIEIFVEGMKILYGDEDGQVALENLNDAQFKRINKFMQSIGFKVNLEVYPQVEKHSRILTIGSTDPRELSYWVLTITAAQNQYCYSIYFTMLPAKQPTKCSQKI